MFIVRWGIVLYCPVWFGKARLGKEIHKLYFMYGLVGWGLVWSGVVR